MPSANVRCLPCHRYAKRQYLAPSGLTKRYKPPPSESLYGLICPFEFRHFTSVNGMLVSRYRGRAATNRHTNKMVGCQHTDGGRRRTLKDRKTLYLQG